jgi:cytochrome c oxidase assembly protein subunit 15
MSVNRTPLAVATVLTLLVVTLGAFVRLSDAGLGCPDWPGCYGRMVVPDQATLGGDAAHTRAWIEMIHRYAAGSLGMLVLFIAWRHRADRRTRLLSAALVGLLLLQALLGMWTVTLKLMPLAVMGHLLGGLFLLGLLWWWYLRRPPRPGALGLVALLLLVLQIALGGWTSANYAGIACPDLPTCQRQWWPDADFRHAFTLPDAFNGSYQGGNHSGRARTAIHLSHRLGALAALVAVGLYAGSLLRRPGLPRRGGLVLLAALLLQWALGLTNVLLHLPLAVAVAHTAGAALLVLALLFAVRSAAAVPPST